MTDGPDNWPQGLTLRSGRDEDAAQLIRLVGDCFSDYENCVLDLDGIDAELKAIATYFADLNGAFRVLESSEGDIIGCIGWNPHDMGMELKKLYVDRRWRRRGLAKRLAGLVEAAAGEADSRFIDLWSDTRFVEAHALYQSMGFIRQPQTRHLNDPSDTTEYYFLKQR